MARLSHYRFTNLASAISCFALGAVLVGFVPFMSAESSAGATLSGATPTMTVNRATKCDRLPVRSAANLAAMRGEMSHLHRALQPEKIPVGCDAAFSPVSMPALAHVYGRCTT